MYLQLPSSWSQHLSGAAIQYFEPALKPWVHFVPLWEDAEDDLVRALQRLQADLPAAAAIAAQGRAFACGAPPCSTCCAAGMLCPPCQSPSLLKFRAPCDAAATAVLGCAAARIPASHRALRGGCAARGGTQRFSSGATSRAATAHHLQRFAARQSLPHEHARREGRSGGSRLWKRGGGP